MNTRPSYAELFDRALSRRYEDSRRPDSIWRFNDKIAARDLAAAVGVRTATLLHGPAELDRIPAPSVPAVLKPQHGCGSRGVFPLVPHQGGYRDLLRHKTLTWREVLSRARRALNTGPGPLHPDHLRGPWLLETLIGDGRRLPHDWKFRVFGGRVGIIWQIDRNRKVGTWWARDWEPVGAAASHPWYGDDPDLPAPRHGAELVATAEAVARHLGVPFTQVDLYEDDDGPVWGEITPLPAGRKLTFTPHWDARLGEMWAAALSSPTPRRHADMTTATTQYPDLEVGLTPLETTRLLYDLAAKVPRTQAVVEIGVFRAHTLLWMAAGAASGKGARAFGVDTWDLRANVKGGRKAYKRAETYRQAQANVAASGLGNVELIRGFSADVAAQWQGPRIGLLYVDGNHTAAAVRADWDAWSPHLVSTATVVWDDYNWERSPGVAEVVDALHAEGLLTAPQPVGPKAVLTRLARRR